MQTILTLPDRTLERADTAIGDLLLGTLARLIFAGVLFFYFWNSAATKVGDGVLGIFTVTSGGFGQIFPKAAEAVFWDVTQMTLFQKAVVLAGTWAEFILPTLIVLGLLTRLAALGMIGFVVVQSLTDIVGHGAEIGGWFDGASNALIADQRALWVFLLAYLVIKGGGLACGCIIAANCASEITDTSATSTCGGSPRNMPPNSAQRISNPCAPPEI